MARMWKRHSPQTLLVRMQTKVAALKAKHAFNTGATNSAAKDLPKKTKSTRPQWDLQESDHGSIICNGPKLEAT